MPWSKTTALFIGRGFIPDPILTPPFPLFLPTSYSLALRDVLHHVELCKTAVWLLSYGEAKTQTKKLN